MFSLSNQCECWHGKVRTIFLISKRLIISTLAIKTSIPSYQKFYGYFQLFIVVSVLLLHFLFNFFYFLVSWVAGIFVFFSNIRMPIMSVLVLCRFPLPPFSYGHCLTFFPPQAILANVLSRCKSRNYLEKQSNQLQNPSGKTDDAHFVICR